MMNLSRCGLAVAFVALVALTTEAQNPGVSHTVITIPDMHCPGCAKKVADKVNAVPNVATVRADTEAHVLVVTPRPQSAMSPRQLWEAVEAAGKKPTKLECPAGTFTAKPQS